MGEDRIRVLRSTWSTSGVCVDFRGKMRFEALSKVGRSHPIPEIWYLGTMSVRGALIARGKTVRLISRE